MSVHVEIKAFKTVSCRTRIAACTIVSGAIEQVGYGNHVVKDSCSVDNYKILANMNYFFTNACMYFVELQEEKKVSKSNYGYCSWNKTILVLSIK